MSTYVMSDIHGQYDMYIEMLEKINFSEDDMLYILGDVIDRGPNPVKILLDIMERPNVVCLAGNHCVMACDCMNFLLKEVTDESIDALNDELMGKLCDWMYNGAGTTIEELGSLPRDKKKEVLDFIMDFDLYEEVMVGDREYILVHAGLGNFSPDREIFDYELDELVWERPDYSKPYFDDRYVITGHTPTMAISENPRPGYIYINNNHIAIDCGCTYKGGRLACLRLEDMKEFYVESEII